MVVPRSAVDRSSSYKRSAAVVRGRAWRNDWCSSIELPWQLYRGSPHWVLLLRLAVRDALNERKNLFFSHAKPYSLLAFRHGKPIGRLVGIIDCYYHEFHACELSWVLEDNPSSQSLGMVGAKKTKAYRIYQAFLP